MITKMKKMTFLVYHKEYDDFLKSIREAGVVHVKELGGGNFDDPDLQDKLLLFKQISDAIKRLRRVEIDKLDAKEQIASSKEGKEVLADLESMESRQAELKHEIANYSKLVETLAPWGDFDQQDCMVKLEQAGLELNFFICNDSNFDEKWIEDYNAIKISKEGSKLHFITLTPPKSTFDINAEYVKLPKESLKEAQKLLDDANNHFNVLQERIEELAKSKIPSLEAYQHEVQGTIEFSKVVLSTAKVAEEKVMVLQGWIPEKDSAKISTLLDESDIYYDISDPTTDDDVPIELNNKGIFSWFEPICRLYMLPKYNELDLTPFFAPFFMIFFGLCLGDSGYGLFLVVATTLYRVFAKNISATMKPILSLIQVLGISTFLCGLLTGGFFGAQLYDLQWPFVQWLKSLVFLDNGEMFKLSLVLGVIQILFGMALKVVNETIQFGFKFAIGTLGWVIFLTYTVLLVFFPSLGTIGSTTYMIVTAICAAAIFLYNDPSKNIFTNIGLGLWNTYNMVTGLLGDILSYVRLFALGLSGGILASVFNSLASGMSPDNAILGPIVMILIFVVGHAINIFMNVLGAMVHPMRLTFVEFFKNAGYEGGGNEYKPFKKIN